MKKITFILFISIFFSSIFAANNKVNFIKGNITDKTNAVREATEEEGIWLSTKAIDYVLESKEILGTDRDLDVLAVSAILSIPSDFLKNISDPQIPEILNSFLDLFTEFSDSSTVQTAVLSKVLSVKDYIDVTNFTLLLNNYITNINISTADSSIIKAIINSLESIGNNESFIILYNAWNNKKFTNYYEDIEKALVSLSAKSTNEVIQIIHHNDLAQICKVFSLVTKNNNISKNYLCEIAENALSESILLVSNSSLQVTEVSELQLQALQILDNAKWTRASSIATNYLSFSKKQYDDGLVSEDIFSSVVKTMPNIAPIDSVPKLCAYLEEFNSQKEKGVEPSSQIVLTVINTLGAIGNKSALDYLLAVTYLTYPEEVKSAAIEALAGLRWQ